MKIFAKALIIISIIIHGCEVKKNGLNQFSSSTDTLVVRTEKHKDRGPFLSSHVQVTFENMTKESMKDFLFPSGISKIKAIHLFTDFADEDPNYVDIISGILENEKIFIVDENNNNNFRDDSIRTIKRLKWDSPEGLIKCKYLISNSQEIVEDSSWIQIREDQNILWLGIKEHLTADLNIDNKEFRLGITDLFSGNFTYGTRSWIALLSDNNITKDTLLERDILAIGEVLKLGQNHYRFEDITNNGEYITLIKEKDFYNKVGIQVGMIAPDFTCISVSGDTIRSSTLHDRIMVIANSCGCGGDKESTEAYYQILNKFGDKIHILHLDSKIDKSLEDYHIDMEEDFNKDIYRKYRNEYCSRTCFVIDNNNRIIDRFPIKDWKQYLPNLIDY